MPKPDRKHGTRRRISGDNSARHATIACLNCRARKTRCDGNAKENGSCTRCREAGVACKYSLDDGRRNHRLALAGFHKRISALERARDREESDGRGADDTANTSAQRETLSFVHSERRRTPSPSDYASNDADRAPPYLNLDQGGQVRHFGYTSSMQALPPFWLPNSDIAHEATGWVDTDAAEATAASVDLQTHLAELYFTYQDVALPIVQRDLFMEEWARGKRTQYFSTFLLYTILARAVRLSDRPDAMNARPVFHRRARAELLNELDSPVVSTVQALCIYGHFLTSMGNDRACWLYPGLAYRLAFDLGLHRDCSHLVQRGSMTERDRQIRTSTLWGCYISDKLYAMCQGRPSTISLKDISLSPDLQQTPEFVHFNQAVYVGLSSILDRISSSLNVTSDQSEHKTTLQGLSDTADDLLAWIKSLPSELQWQSNLIMSPGTYAVHMTALTAIILVHRPFATYDNSTFKNLGSRKRTGELPGRAGASSREICTQNSIRIANMITAFRQNYGLEKIFSMGSYFAFTAAISLILESSDLAPQQKYFENANSALDVCVEALRDLGSTFPLAMKHYNVVQALSTSLKCRADPRVEGNMGGIAPLQSSSSNAASNDQPEFRLRGGPETSISGTEEVLLDFFRDWPDTPDLSWMLESSMWPPTTGDYTGLASSTNYNLLNRNLDGFI